MTPLVSVIIPVFNGAETLAEAVASVRAQSVPFEIVIVDDGSTDDTPALISTLGDEVVPLRQSNAGPAAARNLGLAHARGELIAFLDDDDLWTGDKLKTQCRLLEESPDAGLTLGYSEVLSFDGSSRTWVQLVPPRLQYVVGAALVRRAVFDQIGTFDPTMRFGEDGDWFLRARDAGVGMLIGRDLVMTVRRNGDNMTRGKTLAELQVFEVLKRSIHRRRGK